jgi:hypothetical protein
MTTGLVLMGAGMLLYALVGPDVGVWPIRVAFVLTGAGLAFNTGPAVSLAMSAVSVDRAGLASGVVNLARLTGITVGIAVMGTVLALVSAGAASGPAFVDAVRAAVLVGALAELLGAVVAFGYTGKERSRDTAPTKEMSHA